MLSGPSPSTGRAFAETAYVTIKYDRDGHRKWLARYQGAARITDQASCSTPYVVNSNDGNVQAGCTEADYATLELRPDGERVWVARYHGAASGNYVPGALAVGECEGVYVTGSGTMADQGFHVLKYDREGHEVWATVFRSTQHGNPGAIAVDRRGNAYIAGLTTLASSAYFTLVAYGNDGSVLWDREVQGADTTRDWDATAVVVDREGLLHATGGTLDVPIVFGGATQSWYLTRAYDADTGELAWSEEF